jgi:hypothetical protein
VIKGVASPNRNQAIIQGGKEIAMSLIVAAGYAGEPESPSSIGQSTAGNIETMSVDRAFNVDTCSL